MAKKGINQMDIFVESLKRKTREFIRQPSALCIEVIGANDKNAKTIELSNASLGGIACRSNRYWPVDEIVKIRIPFFNASFETEGKVVWCLRCESYYEIGIQFVDHNLPPRLRLIEQLNKINASKKNENNAQDGNEQRSAVSPNWLGQAPAF